MSGFEPSPPCFRAFYRSSVFLLVGEWINGCLSNVLFTVAVGLQMSGFEPSLFLLLVLFFALFSVIFFGWVRGLIISATPILLFFTSYPRYTCFWLSKSPNAWRTSFLVASLHPKIPRKILVTSAQP